MEHIDCRIILYGSGDFMLHILLTFDYELYFNDCEYTEKEVLIQPTKEIMKCLDSINVKGTFFVDTPSIYKYKEYGLDHYIRFTRSWS
jgi:hypothetical protein